MEDISNKTLAILLVAAMAVSLGGTVLSLNRLGSIPTQQITGYGTGIGFTNLTIMVSTSIFLNNTVVDFGTGIVNITAADNMCLNATLTSGNSTDGPSNLNNCWVNASGPRAVNPFNDSINNIIVRNEGNTNLTIEMVSADGTAANFIGGGTGGPFPEPQYQFTSYSAQAGSCSAPRTSWTDINATEMYICSGQGLSINPSSNEVAVGFRIVIPGDAAGYKEDQLTFTSSEAT